MKFENLANNILKESHGIPSVFEVKERLDKLEDELGHLRRDQDFIDYVKDVVRANAEDAKDSEIDEDEVVAQATDRIRDIFELEDLAKDYFEEHPDRKLRPHLHPEIIDNFRDILKDL